MTDKIAIATELPDANLAAIGADAISASNDALAVDGVAGPGAIVPASVGELLRTTREAQGLSAGDIAAKLRMGVRQVGALESSDFAALPTGTFLRGFVRNYAKVVGLNSDEVLALLEKTHDSAAVVKATPVVVPAQQNITMPAPGGELATPKTRAVAAVLVVIVLLGAFWYWWEFVRPHLGEGGRAREPEMEQAVRAPEVAPPAITAEAVTLSPTPKDSTPAESVPVTSAVPPAVPASSASISAAPTTPIRSPAQTLPATIPAAVAATVVQPVPAAPASVAAPVVKGGGVLGFTFNGDSWVEVTDGSGKTVLSKRFTAGEAEEVNGRPPFSVVIGNAQVTRMAFNGKEFDLVPHTRVSVARVTVK